MEEKLKEPLHVPDDQARCDRALDNPPDTSEAFKELFDPSDESPSHEPEMTDGAVVEAINALATQVSHLAEMTSGLDSRSSRIESEVGRIKTEHRVITEMHDRTRTLTEGFHEREVLSPIFLGLIGIADRCEQSIQDVERAAKKYRQSTNRAGLAALRSIREARAADRIEIESYLAGLGVERFETTSPAFDPETQTCAKRVTTSVRDRSGKIAERLLPGYRRNGKVIRQERVAVYVAGHAIPHSTEGVRP